VVADDALEEGTSGLRTVEHAGVGDLELAEGQLVGVAGLEVVRCKWRGQTVEPAPEEGVYGIGTQSVADALEGGRIGAPTETVVECLVCDAGLV